MTTLPEVWRIPHIARFSHAKKLYDYQQDALKRRRGRFFYIMAKTNNGGVPMKAERPRKRAFAQLYSPTAILGLDDQLSRFDTPEYDDRKRGKETPSFRCWRRRFYPARRMSYLIGCCGRGCVFGWRPAAIKRW